MTLSDWIQLGTLIVYTISFIIGGIVALLRLSHIIVDIEQRQRRIDESVDKWKDFYHEGEKHLRDITWRNTIALTGLALVISVLLLIDRKKVK